MKEMKEIAARLPGVFTFDRSEYVRLWSDTPLNCPDVPDALNLHPGTCVKTMASSLSDMVFGRVHRNASILPNPEVNECIVIGHGWDNTDEERFVWRGTQQQFHSTWRVD